jgi:hypothetical protein
MVRAGGLTSLRSLRRARQRGLIRGLHDRRQLSTECRTMLQSGESIRTDLERHGEEGRREEVEGLASSRQRAQVQG